MLKCNCFMTVWLNVFCLHEAWLMLTESKIIRKMWLLKNLLSSQYYWRRMNITDCGSCGKSRTEKGFFFHQWLGDLYTWLSLTLMGVICLIFYEPDVKLMAVFPLSLVGCGSTAKCTNEFCWNIGASRLRISTCFIHSCNKKCCVNAREYELRVLILQSALICVHFGASTQQTAEMPEPACNELVWAGTVICPAAWGDLLFIDLSGSRCNGICGLDQVVGELQCHAMLWSHQ